MEEEEEGQFVWDPVAGELKSVAATTPAADSTENTEETNEPTTKGGDDEDDDSGDETGSNTSERGKVDLLPVDLYIPVHVPVDL